MNDLTTDDLDRIEKVTLWRKNPSAWVAPGFEQMLKEYDEATTPDKVLALVALARRAVAAEERATAAEAELERIDALPSVDDILAMKLKAAESRVKELEAKIYFPVPDAIARSMIDG